MSGGDASDIPVGSLTLLELAVTDLAVIERVRLPLGPGFTVVTGETGAGKSLLIDALQLVLGGRADSGLVREGAPQARVEALFDRVPEPMICAREVSATGRSVARIDDAAVTAARLAETVTPLIEIHGQHEQQRLLSPGWQRELLDAYGMLAELRAATAAAVAEWRENAESLAALDIDQDELERRIALREHAAAEIEAAAPQLGEADRLRGALAVAASAADRRRLAETLRLRLSAEGTGARDVAARAGREAIELARLDPRLQPIADRLATVEAELEDIASELRRATAETDDEPATVAEMEARLGLLYGLLRKYGDDEAAVIAHGDAARAEVERLRGLEGERSRRAVAAVRLQGEAHDRAERLGAARRAAAVRLAPAVTATLVELGFPGASFSVAVEPAALSAAGSDTVTFLLAPNPGEPPRPLARIASGGELSRVALAIKAVLAAADTTPTLVFDEVDAGIGGRSADPIGRNLWRLARDHQVICVTHLPQIAAYADAHVLISKHAHDGRTRTEVHLLEREERLEELAQMLGGGAGARAAARELLDRAEATTARASAAA